MSCILQNFPTFSNLSAAHRIELYVFHQLHLDFRADNLEISDAAEQKRDNCGGEILLLVSRLNGRLSPPKDRGYIIEHGLLINQMEITSHFLVIPRQI